MSQEINDVIYNHELFPKAFTSTDKEEITENDLNISDFYIEVFRNSNEKITLDYEKFNKTLAKIFSNNNNLLQIRAIILIFMLKNCIDATTIFEIILTVDILNKDGNEESDDAIFISNNHFFNDIFFKELSKSPLLILDLVEIIKSFVKITSLGYEAIYPIINKIILANEDSMTPVDSNKLIFMDESDIKPEHKEKIQKSYPIILPFKLKYEEYLKHNSQSTTVNINVNRDNILEAVLFLDDISNCNCYIKVHFGEGEIDAGGPRREFIDLAFKAIVLPETDLFELRNGYYWFKYHPTMTEDLKKKYRSFGVLLGIAINNRFTIPIHFPRYFYKKLLHRDIHMSDLNIFDPELFSSLTELLKYEIDTELDFSYIDSIGGYEVDLTNFSYVDDPDTFEPAPLTEQNKADYVSKIIDWIFNFSVRESFAAFEEGYKKVNINPMLYDSFMLDEIDKIVSGNPVLDWNALKQSASYSGYTKNSKVIKWFWQYFDTLTNDKKFEALKFITGATSVPTGGLKDIRITFRKISGSYPLAHTSFFAIDLPNYTSYDELKRKCSEAFPNSIYGFA